MNEQMQKILQKETLLKNKVLHYTVCLFNQLPEIRPWIIFMKMHKPGHKNFLAARRHKSRT